MTIEKLKKTRITRKGLIRKLDKLVSQIVILRDKKCVCCGRADTLTCGHLFTRAAYSTRWDLGNCYAQCLSCNFRHEYDPYIMIQAVVKIKGDKYVDELHIAHKQTLRLKDWQMQDMVRNFEVILKDLERKE